MAASKTAMQNLNAFMKSRGGDHHASLATASTRPGVMPPAIPAPSPARRKLVETISAARQARAETIPEKRPYGAIMLNATISILDCRKVVGTFRHTRRLSPAVASLWSKGIGLEPSKRAATKTSTGTIRRWTRQRARELFASPGWHDPAATALWIAPNWTRSSPTPPSRNTGSQQLDMSDYAIARSAAGIQLSGRCNCISPAAIATSGCG